MEHMAAIREGCTRSPLQALAEKEPGANPLNSFIHKNVSKSTSIAYRIADESVLIIDNISVVKMFAFHEQQSKVRRFVLQTLKYCC
jgi:hypothetical protein